MSLLLVFAATAAAEAQPPLTLREALALPPRELATRVLGMAGARYREARIWDGRSNFGDTGRATIEFASMPRTTGNSEICVADTMYVSFLLVGDRRAGPDRRLRLDSQEGAETSHVYRIIGDTTDRRERSDAEERALDAQCAHAGPVLADSTTHRFFVGPRLGAAEAYLAARMLQTVMTEAQRGAVGNLTCTENAAAPAAGCLRQSAGRSDRTLDGSPARRLTRTLPGTSRASVRRSQFRAGRAT